MDAVAKTWLLFKHYLKMTLRNPVFVIVGLFQPICQLLLYAPLLKGLPSAPGLPPGQAYMVFTPGLLVLLGVTSVLFVGFGFIAEMRAGVLERMRVTPVSRLALVLSRSFRDIVVLLVQSFVLLGLAWFMGLDANLNGVLISLVLIILIGLLTSSASYALALALPDENTISSILNLLMLPVLLLSGITLPLVLAPQWIQNIASFNPFSYAVDATRLLFAGDLGAPGVLYGFGVIGGLTVLSLIWAVRSFRQGVA